MPVIPRSGTDGLYARFETGRFPSGADFHDFLDSFYHKQEDTIAQGGWVSFALKDDATANGLAPLPGGGVQGSMTVPVPANANRLTSFFISVGTNSLGASPSMGFILRYLTDSTLPITAPTGTIEGLRGYDLIGDLFSNPFTPVFQTLPNESPVSTLEMSLAPPGIDLTFNRIRFLWLRMRFQNVSYDNGYCSFNFGN